MRSIAAYYLVLAVSQDRPSTSRRDRPVRPTLMQRVRALLAPGRPVRAATAA
ncbi:MAG TPA: hypothetical protein VKB00_07440 [Candidatus Limnocylindrales bacterium]|jgi:hypothetical protein|nr:hypothetical protein [Candidatus Limnocylindrales bacterium]